MIFKPAFTPTAYVLLGACSVFPSLTLADESLRLAESTITATRTEQAAAAVASVSTLTRQDIERNQSTNVPDLLRTLAGVNVVSNGGRGKSTSVSLRGTQDKHLLVLIDGVKIGSATSGSAALQNLPIEQIERIEVVRGPRSSLYGSEAVGGVIQIFTRKAAHDGIRPYASLGVGSESTVKGSVGVEASQAGAWLNASIASEDTDGINARSYRDNAPLAYEPDDDGYRALSGAVRGGYRFANGLELDGTVLTTEYRSHFDSRSTRGTSGLDAYTDGQEQVLGARARFSPMDRWKVTLQAGHSEDKTEQYQDQKFYSLYHTKRDAYSWQNDIVLSANQLLTVGVDYQYDRIDTDSNYVQTSRYNQGAFAQYQARLGDHALQASLRHDKDEFFGSYDTGSLGWRYALNETLSVLASYGTAFRAPTFNDLYYPASASTAGNPDVQPEESESYELGISGTHDWGDWAVNAYETQITDLIEWQGNSPMRPTNVSSARIRGLETSLTTELLGWELAGNITLMDPRDHSDQNHGKLLQRRAKRSLNLDLDRRFGAVGVGASLFATSYRYDDNANSEAKRMDGYALVDLRADYRFNPEWQVQMKVSNLFDREYQTAQTYEQPGRALLFTLRYQAL